jgi:hypothetical protein
VVNSSQGGGSKDTWVLAGPVGGPVELSDEAGDLLGRAPHQPDAAGVAVPAPRQPDPGPGSGSVAIQQQQQQQSQKQGGVVSC